MLVTPYLFILPNQRLLFKRRWWGKRRGRMLRLVTSLLYTRRGSCPRPQAVTVHGSHEQNVTKEGLPNVFDSYTIRKTFNTEIQYAGAHTTHESVFLKQKIYDTAVTLWSDALGHFPFYSISFKKCHFWPLTPFHNWMDHSLKISSLDPSFWTRVFCTLF